MDAAGEYFSLLALKRLAQFLHSQIHFATEMLTVSSAKLYCIISTCFTCPVTSNCGTRNSTPVLRHLIGVSSSQTKCLMQLSWKYFCFIFLRPKTDVGFQSRFCSPLFRIRKVSLSNLSYSDSVYSSFSSDHPQKCRRRLKPLHAFSNSYPFLINSLLIQQ